MARAQYETRTETVEKTVVVLELSEDEADDLRDLVAAADGTRRMVSIFNALQKPEAPRAEESADTFEYDGVRYDLRVPYRDRDGDVWYFARFGDGVRAGIGRTPRNADDGDPFRTAAGYGPLTKVTE
ncbi:phiSA1p31-related protein [Streptomyces hydrogenans]|uniref:phiSA1p31-related protein n=1 Tax=Streptomyces hydrogenans TaxID=1873719 RepID=UPI0035D62914